MLLMPHMMAGLWVGAALPLTRFFHMVQRVQLQAHSSLSTHGSGLDARCQAALSLSHWALEPKNVKERKLNCDEI